MMDLLISEFPKQLKEALALAKTIRVSEKQRQYKHILVIGMGGSGIGGHFLQEFISAECPLPILSHKGYELPAYVGEESFVICSSYSGNTEETLMSAEEAQARGAKLFCIASGGTLIDKAKNEDLDYVQLPASSAPPRACLGYSLVQQIGLAVAMGWASKQRLEELDRAATVLEDEKELIRAKAKKIASFLAMRFPVLYATERHAAVALRLRQQLNENAKILCSHHLIPEMNHNELVGWRKQPVDFAVLIFKSQDEHSRNLTRIDINKDIIGNFTDTLIEVVLRGDSLIEQSLYGVYLGDWLSWELSILRQVDAVEVKVIDFLKSQLALSKVAEAKTDTKNA